MGTTHTFKCTGCGYKARVSGGEDAGKMGKVVTLECLDCCKLQDFWTWDIHMTDSSPPRQPRCRKNPAHDVKPWTAGSPCPRCRAPMLTGPEVTTWD